MARNPAKAVSETESRDLAVRRQLDGLMESVPEAGGDGLGILERIANVTSPDELVGENQGTTPVESLFGHALRIDRISKVQSSYAGQPFDWFMVLEGQDTETGETFVTSTSGATVMVTCAKMREFGVFPIVIRITESETRNGYTVQNCAVLHYSKDTVDA